MIAPTQPGTGKRVAVSAPFYGVCNVVGLILVNDDSSNLCGMRIRIRMRGWVLGCARVGTACFARKVGRALLRFAFAFAGIGTGVGVGRV